MVEGHRKVPWSCRPREAGRRVDRVVHRRGSVVVALDVHHDQVGAARGTARSESSQPRSGEVGEEQSRVRPGSARSARRPAHVPRANGSPPGSSACPCSSRPRTGCGPLGDRASGCGRGRRRSGRSGSRRPRAGRASCRRAARRRTPTPRSPACPPGSRSRHHAHQSPVEDTDALVAAAAVGAHAARAGPPGHRRPASGCVGLERHLGAQHVALEHRRRVVAAAPREDRDQIGQRAGDVGGRDRDRVPAVDEPPAVGADAPASVCAGATLSVRRTSSGAAVTVSRPSISQTVPASRSAKCAPGTRSRNASRCQPAGTAAAHPIQVELLRDAVEAVGVARPRARVAQRDHRAAPEVEHRLPVLVARCVIRSATRPVAAPSSRGRFCLSRRPRCACAACRRRTPAAAGRARGRRGCRARAASGPWTGRSPRRRRGSGGPGARRAR